MRWTNCAKCSIWIIKKSNSHKYCRACAAAINLQKQRKRGIRQRQRNREDAFGPHMKRHVDGSPDFKSEEKAIKKEMQKLGLRK